MELTSDWLTAMYAQPGDSLSGKRALVTGGGKGVGKGIALSFARKGAHVAIGCNSNPDMARDTLGQLRELTRAILIPSDIADPAGCRLLIDECARELGGLDILVCNAAIQTQHSLLESSYDIFKSVLNVNLRSAFLLMKYAYPYLSRSGSGRIICITSVHGKRATDFDAAYSTSKGALEMLCREAAVEFAKDRITVNLIAPGGVVIEGKTGDPKPFSTIKVQRSRPSHPYPLGRSGLPRDTGAVACFLATEGAEHITGTTIRVDGGMVLM